MLVLTRKAGEEIVLPNQGVTIGVVAVNGRKVRLGIAAPPETSVHRKEVWHRIRESRESGPDSCEADCEPLRAGSRRRAGLRGSASQSAECGGTDV
jgi:carbon storage regulator